MTPEEKRSNFLKLSSALTGIAVNSAFPGPPRISAKAGDLSPRNSPIDLAGTYMSTIDTELGAQALTTLLERFVAEGGEKSQLGAAGKVHADAALGGLCRCIMKLWFLGVWFDPSAPRVAKRVVSTQTYKEGLVWKVMQAHPMGYSMWTFGHWQEAPPALDKFVTVNVP